MSGSIATSSTGTGKIRSPWAVWCLSVLTLGVHYLVWYVRLNKEIAGAAGVDVTVRTVGLWLSQCVPIANWVSLAHTARRLQTALELAAAETSVSAGRTMLASLWFGSHTRYLQRRANELWRALDNQAVAAQLDPFDLIYAHCLAQRALTAGPQAHAGRHKL
jgi:hypothetical protein